MNKVPTAKQMLEAHFHNGKFIEIHSGDIDTLISVMIEYAQLHVNQATIDIAEKVEVKTVTYGSPHTSEWDKVVDKSSILNAYPKELIK